MGPLKCFQFPNLHRVSGRGSVGALKQVCKVRRKLGSLGSPRLGEEPPVSLLAHPSRPRKQCDGGCSPAWGVPAQCPTCCSAVTPLTARASSARSRAGMQQLPPRA